MSDFFKQLLTQFRDIWTRFNSLQKLLLVAVFLLTFAGVVATVVISGSSAAGGRWSTLFANMEVQDAGDITGFLTEANFTYKLDNSGRTILVPKEQIHEIRMQLARSGLPRQTGKGYELFDKNQLGMTDFAQNLNYRRAVETEITRSIETFREVEKARVHVNIPRQTLFMERKEEASASVIVKLRPGEVLQERQVRGITHLVASAIEGLVARQVTVLDDRGNMLTKGFADNAVAEQTDHNMELKRSVEKYLEHQVTAILDGVLGPNKSRVKVSAELDFDRISKTVETYDPTKKVVRSEQRDDGTRTNNPMVGNEQKEGSITNYEINRTVAQVMGSPGATRRLTVSVAVDGTWETGADGNRIYKPRSAEDLATINQLVKNAVGFSAERADDVFVAGVQFDRSHLETEMSAMAAIETRELWETWALRLTLALVALLAFLFLRKVATSLIEAMNPPLPRYAGIDLEVEEEEIPEHVKRQNELIDRLEEFSMANPTSVADLIRIWIMEDVEAAPKKNKR